MAVQMVVRQNIIFSIDCGFSSLASPTNLTVSVSMMVFANGIGTGAGAVALLFAQVLDLCM